MTKQQIIKIFYERIKAIYKDVMLLYHSSRRHNAENNFKSLAGQLKLQLEKASQFFKDAKRNTTLSECAQNFQFVQKLTNIVNDQSRRFEQKDVPALKDICNKCISDVSRLNSLQYHLLNLCKSWSNDMREIKNLMTQESKRQNPGVSASYQINQHISNKAVMEDLTDVHPILNGPSV